jgi:putative ABC transport system ATP-binding protein
MKSIKKIYGNGEASVEALRGVDLHVNKGDFLTVVGPSGSGKSTLMNILGCLDKPTEGSYYLNNKNVKKLNDNQLSEIRNEEIGFVFQNFNLLSYATAYENVEMPLLFAGLSGKRRKNQVESILDKVGLADEPTGNLDSETGEDIMELFIKLWKEGNTIIMITHDPRATRYSDKAVKLVDGKIVI